MHAESAQSRRLKVLMTADAVGGVWQYSVDLAAALAHQNVEVLLATMGPHPSAAQRNQIATIPNVQLVESDFALEWMPDGLSDMLASTEWLRGLQDRFQPDLLHLNGYGHAAWPWGVPTLAVAHSCVYSWWRAVHGDQPPAEWAGYKNVVEAGLQRASLVVAPSRAMAHALETEYGIDTARVIPNFSPSDAAGGTTKQPFCLSAGRVWDQAKNISLIGQIASQLDWPVRIAGEKDPSVHNSNGIEWMGFISHGELMRKMQAASIFIHPALYEPFGLSVLEAARRGCCLVLSDIDSLRELWDGCAQFVDPRDPELWTFELNRLMRDRVERQTLAARARKHSERYTQAATVSAYLDHYRSLVMPKGEAAKGAAA